MDPGRLSAFRRLPPFIGSDGRFHGVDDTSADIRELILPTTDAGVAIQLVLVVITGALAWVLLRRQRDARLLVVGATLFGLGLIGLRALH